jgi:RNA polymerase sigma factor (TIGR02999 family)
MTRDGRPDDTVTRLLHEWQAGSDAALDRLLPVVYGELRRLARRALRGERSGHTLQTTALVHEAYLRLVGADVPWRDRVHFFAVAARCMRRVLVDHARARASDKRGGDVVRVTLTEDLAADEPTGLDLVALDQALGKLETRDPRKAWTVEMHYFAGLTLEEIAELHGVAAVTVKKDLRFARAFLREALSGS